MGASGRRMRGADAFLIPNGLSVASLSGLVPIIQDLRALPEMYCISCYTATSVPDTAFTIPYSHLPTNRQTNKPRSGGQGVRVN